jgi:CHAT domain-containing protein
VVGERPETAPLLAELRAVSARLGTLSLLAPEVAISKVRREEIAQLSAQKESLEGKIALASHEFRSAARSITAAEIQSALPADVALVDFLMYFASHPQAKGKGVGLVWEHRLAAFVLRREGPVQLVDLGLVEPISEAVDAWRADFGNSAEARKAAAQLRERLWIPIEKCLREATKVLVSPDGALGKLPLGALPGNEPGSYLIETYAITTIPSPQSLLDPGRQGAGAIAASGLLVVSGVDYNRHASPAKQVSPRIATARAAGEARFQPLPGTTAEAAAIQKLFGDNLAGEKLTLLAGDAAEEHTVVRATDKHRYLHLATHGYFAAAKYKSALSRSIHVGPDSDAEFASNQSLAGYHPGLLSGLALAGANEPNEVDDGILTAEEVSSLNLGSVELVVLSACETGLGERAGGEGLLGLQRAFQVAGAKTVIASLWSVPDQSTRLLMVRFYENLWQRKMGKSEALREAQLWMLRRGGDLPEVRRELVARGLDEVASAPAAERRLPPYFWAAFVASGDCR